MLRDVRCVQVCLLLTIRHKTSNPAREPVHLHNLAPSLFSAPWKRLHTQGFLPELNSVLDQEDKRMMDQGFPFARGGILWWGHYRESTGYGGATDQTGKGSTRARRWKMGHGRAFSPATPRRKSGKGLVKSLCLGVFLKSNCAILNFQVFEFSYCTYAIISHGSSGCTQLRVHAHCTHAHLTNVATTLSDGYSMYIRRQILYSRCRSNDERHEWESTHDSMLPFVSRLRAR